MKKDIFLHKDNAIITSNRINNSFILFNMQSVFKIFIYLVKSPLMTIF